MIDERLCQNCPGQFLSTGQGLVLISDNVQFFAAREAAQSRLEGGTPNGESPQEAAESLAHYRLNDILHTDQGSYGIVRNPNCLKAGIDCARRLVLGECTKAENWFQVNSVEDPSNWQ
jgi:hypothetical protein